VLWLEEIVHALGAGFPPLRARPLFVHRALAVEPDARGPDGATPVFAVPDLHVLSEERARGYGEFFHLNAGREKALVAFLRRLVELRDDPADRAFAALAVYQLGDLHDLWREAAHWWWHEDLAAMLERQRASHAALFALLGELDATRLVGNHDDRLRDRGAAAALAGTAVEADLPLARLVPDVASLPWGAHSRIDFLHADQVDPVETGPFHGANHIGARLAAHGGAIDLGEVDEWRWELLPPGAPDPDAESAPLPEAVIDFDAPLADPKQDRAMRVRFFAESEAYARRRGAARGGLACAAVVVGHTHAPRIVVRRGADGYALADCGSWLNRGVDAARGTPFWNGQVGALSGAQIAVLQIDL